RRLLGVVVGVKAVAVQAHQIGSVPRLLQHGVDHPCQTLRKPRRIVATAEASVAGGGGEASQLAVDRRAARERVLGLLEDKKTAALAGDQSGPAVVGGDQARAPVCREEELLELVVGAAAEGHVEVVF